MPYTTEVYDACCDDPVIIAGSSAAKVSKTVITTGAPQVLVAASLASRDGIAIRNNETIGSGNILWFGFTVGQADPSAGWPITEQGGITLNIGPGVTIYAVASQNTIDVRVLETGN